MRILPRVILVTLLSSGARGALAQRATADSGAYSDTLVVHLLGRRVGHETSTLQRSERGLQLTSNLDFIDRGSHVQLESVLNVQRDFTPTAFHAKGQTYRFVNV